ncbi:MAG: PKD domain-containing protein [Anaerolineae bacterium]|nr:PKD domain-containing protein [Anaerolineae bacterium]
MVWKRPSGWASYTGLAGIVQEILNQSYWAAGNSLTLVIEGRGSDWERKFFTAFEADPALAPQLMIAWYLPDTTPVAPTTEPTVEAPVEATPTAERSLEPTVEPTLEPTIEPTTTPVPTEVPPTSTPTPEPTLALVPTVTISADGLVGTASSAVQFRSVVTDASDYAGDFGDGVGVSLEANPVYTYTTPGAYLVTLIVTGEGGTASTTLTITVQ